ncbi:MAG: DUF547 domain-containing protein [Lentisphaeria bacterium]|nr:DUF547 domain-containing protein [Lentisphaeria bacterium]
MSVVFMAPTLAAADFDHSHSAYDAVLKAHVAEGRVDYRALKSAPRALNDYLAKLARVSEKQFRDWSKDQQLAYYFNLYNAATLKLIVDHYPVDSIKDIGGWLKGPWDQQVVRLFGGTITLNNLEHDILRKKYDEPRLHLALVCAARGCPPLRAEAYTAEELDKQLDDQARIYLASQAGLRIDRRQGVVYVSAIFKWYGEDFVGNYTPRVGFPGLAKTERAVAGFCARHVSDADQKYLKKGGYKIKYLDYDWSLNTEQPPSPRLRRARLNTEH